MKKFFTQPIGNLSRQNALVFLVINVIFIAVEFSGTTALDAIEDLLNFIWGFSLSKKAPLSSKHHLFLNDDRLLLKYEYLLTNKVN